VSAEQAIERLKQISEKNSGHEFLDQALAWVRSEAAIEQLRAVAVWADAAALARPESARYGLLRMLAGAAAARAARDESGAERSRSVAGAADEAALLDALHALQDRLDAGAKAGPLLDEFARLGARLLGARSLPSIDMRVRTDPDDTVFYWTSGVVALGRGSGDAR